MYDSNLVMVYAQQAIALLLTPGGIGVLAVLIALTIAAFTTDWGKWLCVVISMYTVSLPLIDTAASNVVVLAPPLQQLRAYARLITYSMLALLIIPSLIAGRGWRLRLVHWPIILFFLFEIGICIRLVLYGNAGRGLGAVGAYSVLFIAFGIGISRQLQTVEDFHRLLWCLAIVCGLSAIGTTYQIIVNRAVILQNGRLIGTTGNPQHFAIIMSFGLQVVCYLLTRPSGRKWVRPLLLALIAIMIPLLIWTGSRTGSLSAIIGLLVLFHRNLTRFLVFVPIVGIAVLIALPYFEGTSQIASRLISGENTRGWVFSSLLNRFADNFLFGSATDTLMASENSYLAALADLGIVGASPLLAAVVGVFLQMNYLRRNRPRLGEMQGTVDLVMAMWAVTGVAMFFEGLLLGVGTFTIFWVYAVASATGFVIDWARYTSQAEAEGYPESPNAALGYV